ISFKSFIRFASTILIINLHFFEIKKNIQL
ncbi:unnamed protein product, partial [marine sediment metagenome]